MKVFIVLAHPEHQSFNGAMFRTAVDILSSAGHEIKTTDLYALRFDPASSRTNFLTVKDPVYYKQQIEELYASESYGFADEIEREIQNIEWCDLMIWQFPLWWFGLPGILKGWVDRVFAMGRTYGGDRIYDNGVFRGKRAMLSLTTGGPAAAYEKGGFNGDMTAILRPIQRGILQFTGFDVLAPQIVYGPVRLAQAEREQHLQAYAARLQAVTSEPPIEIGSY